MLITVLTVLWWPAVISLMVTSVLVARCVTFLIQDRLDGNACVDER